jgi:hypothetical protein
MAIKIVFDDDDFQKKSTDFLAKSIVASTRALFEIAGEVMRLSSFEVPHDKGLLQSSGSIEQEGEGFIAGYNKTYASRLHEHPEYRFQKGRKGKYLEDPIKNNLKVLLNYFGEKLKQGLS